MFILCLLSSAACENLENQFEGHIDVYHMFK